MLQVHSDKPSVWISAAKWEMHENNAADTARKLMLRALRYHPNSRKIYHEYFRLELKYVERLRKRKQKLGLELNKADEVPDKVLEGEIANIVYRNAIKAIPDAEFHIPFVKICEEFDFTQELKDKILTDLRSFHADDEVMWNFLAQRELISQRNRNKSEKSLEDQINSCLDVYKIAIERLPTAKMFRFKIEALLAMKENLFYAAQRFLLTEAARTAFNEAAEKKLLSEELFNKWLTIINNDEPEKERVLKLALTEFSDSIPFWKMYITCKIGMELPEKDIERLFDVAMESTRKEETLPLWQLAVDWALTVSQQKAIALLKKSLTTHVPNIVENMKVRYLEVTASNNGIKGARKFYKNFKNYPPIAETFFWKMFELEQAQEGSSIKYLREVLEDIITHFGKTNVDVWLRLIETELSHPDGDACLISGIHWRAIKNLNADLESKFLAAYTLLNCG